MHSALPASIPMKPLVLSLLISLCATSAGAATLQRSILDIQHQWARISYVLPADKRTAAFKALSHRASALVRRYPNRAAPLVWDGIVLSCLARAQGGWDGLDMVKKARDLLQASLRIDPTALGGLAYTSLATLYFSVPGWPISFGSDAKAKAYFKKALAINPKGIDPNYFYADYLYEQNHYGAAMAALKRALAAPPRPQCPLSDKGRHEDIAKLMSKVRAGSHSIL